MRISTLVSDFKYLVISDIHLGNKRNPTKRIISNLDGYFDNYSKDSKFSKLDAIFIAGDLFDKLLDLESDDYYDIVEWLIRLMYFCKGNDIILRILLGTPSHDRHQPKISDILYKAIGSSFDFDYINTLKIETLKKSNITVLYIPDEYHPDVNETYRQVKELLIANNLQKVDIAIMHGMFRYQAPIISDKLPLHDESSYLDIVNYYISIGHVHTFSVYKRIIAQGSFDRMSHGQEEAKGAVVCTIKKTGTKFEFIENKKALIFKTIRLKTTELEKSLEYVKSEIAKLQEGSHVRIVAPKSNPILQAIKDLKVICLGYHITAMSTEDEEQKSQELLLPKLNMLNDSYIPITLDQTNIISLILEEIDKSYNFSGDQTLELKDILQEIV